MYPVKQQSFKQSTGSRAMLLTAFAALFLAQIITTDAVAPLVRVGRSLADKKCDATAATTFTPLTPSVISASVHDMVWEGADDKHVFVLTKAYSDNSQGAIWRSTDGGSTFSDITSNFKAPSGIDSLRITKLMAQKSKPSNMLLITSGPYIWKTSDYGLTVEPIPTPGTWVAATAVYRVHPYHDDWILALVKRKECAAGDRRTCAYDLMLTKDAFTGLTWQNLTANTKGSIAGFVDFDWAANLCPKRDCGPHLRFNDDTIFATMYRHPGDLDQDWDPDVIFTVSDNLFRSHRLNIQCGNQFEIIGRSIYLALANSCPTDIHGKPHKDTTGFPQGISLYTSVDGGYEFTQACLPAALKQASYELTETHDRRGAVAIVDYFVKTTDYIALSTSSIYMAGPHHAIFSLSLVNVFKDPFGITADFSKIEGIQGVYIANQMVSRYGGDDLDLSEREGNYVVTKITSNGGGSWQMITQEKFNNPKCNMCQGQPDCYLHLYGMSTWVMGAAARPAVYSHPSAPGIVLGTGNTGPKGVGLGDNSGLCTWISRDGGATWEDIAEGAYIYEFADWGGILVTAPHEYSGVGDKVMFSMDMGQCWYTVQLDTAMYIHNIRVEPDAQRPRVLIHGTACNKESNRKCMYSKDDPPKPVPEGLVYVLDVTELLGPKLGACKPDLDFETWALPTASHAPACILGAQRHYTRRRPDVLCLQGADYVRPVPVNKTCACTNIDTECDYGYVRSSLDGTCHRIPAAKVKMCPLIHDGRYVVSDTGLRLVHNDICEGVNKVIQDTDGRGTPRRGHHPHNQPGGGPSTPGPAYGFFIFTIVMACIAGVFTVWWKFLAGDGAKTQIQDTCAPVGAFFTSLWGWVMDKVHGRYTNLSSADAELNYFQPLGDAGPADAENHRPQFTL